MSAPTAVTGPVVRSRPVRSAAWSGLAAVAILAAFTTTAVVLPHSTAGVPLFLLDQIAVFGIGVVLAGLALLPVRPRLEADAAGVRARGLLGGYKPVPWTLVRAVEFRPGWRWARLTLPGDEVVSLYAVQRWDGSRSVDTMRALRALHAAALDAAALDAAALELETSAAQTYAAETLDPAEHPAPNS